MCYLLVFLFGAVENISSKQLRAMRANNGMQIHILKFLLKWDF